VNVSRLESAWNDRKLVGGFRGLRKDLVLFDGEQRENPAGFGLEWGGRRSGGSFLGDVAGKGQEAQIPLETGEDAGSGDPDGLALRVDGERV